VIFMAVGSTFWLRRISGWRKDDAILASIPGGLPAVLAVAVDRKASVALIVIVQNLRLFILGVIMPAIVVLSGGGGETILMAPDRETASAAGLALVLFGGLALGAVLAKLKIAAPLLLAGTFVSLAAHGFGVTHGVMPPILTTMSL